MPQVQSDRIFTLLESSKEVESTIRIRGREVAGRLDELLAAQIGAPSGTPPSSPAGTQPFGSRAAKHPSEQPAGALAG